MSQKRDSKKNSIPSQLTICEICGASIPMDSPLCIICGGEKRSSAQSDPLSSAPPEDIQKQRRFPQLIAFILMIITFVASLGVGSFEYFRHTRLKSVYNTHQALVYQNPEGLKIRLSHQQEPYLITSTFDSVSQDNDFSQPITALDSHDQRYIGYLNQQQPFGKGSSGELYLLDLTQFGRTEDAFQQGYPLSTQRVVDFLFSSTKDELVYVTETGDLYACNYSKTSRMFPTDEIGQTLIARNVTGLVDFSDEYILYYTGENTSSTTLKENQNLLEGELVNGTEFHDFSLYLATTTGKEEPVFLADNVICVLDTSKKLDQIFYAKQPSKAIPRFTIYSYHNEDQNHRLLADQVAYLVKADADKGSLLYLTPNESILSYETLFSDRLAEEDQLVSDPSNLHRPIFPTPEEEEELAAAGAKYEAKQTRDAFRNYLRKNLRDFKQEKDISYTLMYKSSWQKESTLLSREIPNLNQIQDLIYVSDDQQYLLFVSGKLPDIQQIDISSFQLEEMEALMEETYDFQLHLNQNLAGSLIVYSLDRNTSHVVYTDQAEKMIGDYRINDSKNEIYFISYPTPESTTGTLYSTAFTSQGAKKLMYIDDSVSAIIGTNPNQSSELYYQTATKDLPPQYTLHTTTPEGTEEIARNTASSDYIQLEADGRLSYFSDYSSLQQRGILVEVVNKQEQLVAKDVGRYLYLNQGDYLLLERPSSSQELVLYEDGELVPLDQDIQWAVSFDRPLQP